MDKKVERVLWDKKGVVKDWACPFAIENKTKGAEINMLLCKTKIQPNTDYRKLKDIEKVCCCHQRYCTILQRLVTTGWARGCYEVFVNKQ